MKGIGFLLAIILIGTCSRNLFPLDEEIYWLGEAVSWVLVAGYLVCTSERYVKIVSIFMAICYVTNLIDEVFFQAYDFAAYKYIIATLAALFCAGLTIRLYLKEHNNISFQS